MTYFWPFFIVRIFTLIPLSILLVRQLVNIFDHPATNGKLATRTALLALTFGLFFDTSVYVYGAILQIITGHGYMQFLGEAQAILFIGKLLVLLAVWKFYRLIYHE